MIHQHTIGACIEFDGVGVHSGNPVRMTLRPAEAGTGILFHVFDRAGLPHEIKAVCSNVPGTDLSTVIGNGRGVHVATIEHLMAALYAAGVDNAIVEIDAQEIPIMDGCSAAFAAAIEAVGLGRQSAKRSYIRVLKSVRVDLGSGSAEYRPHEGMRFEIDIDFPTPAIGRQSFAGELSPALFRDELARARTFGFMKDVERLWASGHALGSSLENSVVIGDDDRVINPDGLRYEDEFVRHKALDAVGDQALAGAPILGCYRSHRGGHKLNALALRALLDDLSAYEIVELPSRRRDAVRRHVPLISSAAAAPAYGPQTL